ncbi:MAG TPA: hypothetical protein VII85_00315 [Candidatus Krumholzibacteriaceae bacterium]
MFGKLKKRTTLDKVANKPVRVIVGVEGRKQEALDLHEPFMGDLISFLEDAVATCAAEYAKSAGALEKMLKAGSVSMGDFRLLKPAFRPICGFIATCADRAELGDWIAANITISQFVECANKIIYLVDLEVLLGNFSEALARIEEAKKKAK